MRIVWSPLAVERIQEEARFIARDKPQAAKRWAESVFSSAEELLELPLRGRVVPELGRQDIRELIHGNYRIIYRVEDNQVAILTLRRGSQLLGEGNL